MIFYSVLIYTKTFCLTGINQFKNIKTPWNEIAPLVAQPAFACSKSIIETPEQCVKYVQR